MEKRLRDTAATPGCVKRVRAARALSAALAPLLCLLVGATAAAQHPHRHPAAPSRPAAAPSSSAAAVRKLFVGNTEYRLPDLTLLDHDGKSVRLYSDLLKDKLFVMGFFYTNCTYICARQGRLFAQLQERLGERLGREVFIVSVTMDPERDTPERLSEWAKRFKRRPGWTLVTGPPREVGKLLDFFTGDSPGPREAHSGLFFVVNDRTGRGAFADGLTPVADIVKALDEVSRP